jgi:hypothetical protein
MLTDTDVHYLAAILTLISSPWGVEIELGPKVKDDRGDCGRPVMSAAPVPLLRTSTTEKLEHISSVSDTRRKRASPKQSIGSSTVDWTLQAKVGAIFDALF